MKVLAGVSLLAVASLAAAANLGGRTGVTPIQKVLTMMNDMLAKAKAEKEAEEVEFAQFKQFCTSTIRDKGHQITKGKEKIEQLSADIDQAGSQAATLAKEIGVIDSDVAAWESEMKEQAFQREKAHADFVATHEEYTESIESVKRAVRSMEEGKDKAATAGSSFAQWQTPEAMEALLQLNSRTSTEKLARARRVVQSFLQRSVDTHSVLMQDAMEAENGAPEAAAYEGQSGGVLDMVARLGDKFEEEREDLERGETNEAHAFQMMQQDLTNQIESGKRMREKKSSAKATAEENKANADGDHGDTSAAVEEDEKFVTDLSTECEQKSMEFEQNQETRAGEIQAIQKAIEIISSDKVSLLSQSASLPEGTVLLQVQSEARSPVQGLVGKFLAERARASDSGVLSLLSERVANDPFQKVTKMIKDMIVKLMEEASEEAEHKGFCDTEMGQNKITRDSKTEEAASLQADIDELTADIQKAAAEIADLGAAITENDAAVAKATAQRSGEKEKNTATIEDAKVAQEAVAQALTVLRDFYEKAAKAAMLTQETSGQSGPIDYDTRAMAILNGGSNSFMQQGAREPYKGAESGGVIGMLEVIQSDFARLESETSGAEATGQKVYEEFMADSAQDKAVKSADMKHKAGKKQKKESALNNAKKDLAATNQELDAALAYFDKLKPSCVDAGETYEERVARRKEEIESLQEALKILAGDGM